ncbi:MAG: sigma-70 family RNA polymerase sigma factor [Aggregatilineales bacterium]
MGTPLCIAWRGVGGEVNLLLAQLPGAPRVLQGMSTKSRDYTTFDDIALVQYARTDSAAFGELYKRYVSKIYSYIYYRTGNAHDAEDLTARVFHRALLHIETYVERGLPFSAWLYRIAHNLVANWHRDRARRKVIPLDEFVAAGLRSEAPESATEQREEYEELTAAIRRLPEERQQLLLLKFVDKLSNADVGTIMDRSEGAIKSLYHRTLQALREDLIARQSEPTRRVSGHRRA